MKKTALLLLSLAALLVLPTAASAAVGKIEGKVFYDPPGAAAPVPVDGAEIEFRTPANAKVGNNVFTDANGNYTKSLFGSEQAGGSHYKVLIVGGNPQKYAYVSPSDGEHDDVQVFGSGTTSGIDFGVRGTTISGHVFNDVDNDGNKDADEPGLPGATVDVAGPRNRTLTTDANGNYTTGEPVLAAGSYTINVSKFGYTDSTPPRIVNPVTGADVTASNSGQHYPTGTVTGRVYAETNGQPGRQAEEPPIAGATVEVTGVVDGQTFTRTTTTKADGTYSLLAFAGNNRTVKATQPGSYADGPEYENAASGVTGADQFSNVNIAENTTVGEFQFGETGATVSGIAFSDRDADGVKDDDEPAIGSRAIDFAAGAYTGTATSGADGIWSVKGLPSGIATFTPAATSDALAPAAKNVSPAPGGTVGGTNFGYRFAGLRGTVLNRQTGAGVAGAEVSLTGDASRTTTTGADGTFSFPDLAPGTYGVRVAPPAGLGLGANAVGTAGGSDDGTAINGVALSLGQIGSGYELGVTGAPLNGGGGTGGGGGGTGGGGGGTGGGTGGGGPVLDTLKPVVKLKVVGRRRCGRRVRLAATVTDASGLRLVTIKAGARKARAKRSLRVKLPCGKRRRMTVVVVAVDKAGNRTVLRRTVRFR